MLVEMYPELAEYLDDDGKLTAECLKALYGLIESGRLCDIAESIITWFEAEFDELKVTRGKIHKFT
eukprot:gene61740-biopygen17827